MPTKVCSDFCLFECRSRQHAPLMHQTSHSGQGSLGQPARIEAFWPSPANSRPPSHASPHRPPPRAGSQGRKRQHQKRGVGNSPIVGHRAAVDSLKADLGLEGSDMVDLQELGRPLKGNAGVVPETKSPAGLQLTRHLEYDILQCIAKDRPEVRRHHAHSLCVFKMLVHANWPADLTDFTELG